MSWVDHSSCCMDLSVRFAGRPGLKVGERAELGKHLVWPKYSSRPGIIAKQTAEALATADTSAS